MGNNWTLAGRLGKARQRQRRKDRVLEKNRALVAGAKANGCVRCGEKDPACLDFNHLDPSKKRAAVSSLLYKSTSVLLAEIGKCEVLCANCHRRHHSEGWVKAEEKYEDPNQMALFPKVNIVVHGETSGENPGNFRETRGEVDKGAAKTYAEMLYEAGMKELSEIAEIEKALKHNPIAAIAWVKREKKHQRHISNWIKTFEIQTAVLHDIQKTVHRLEAEKAYFEHEAKVLEQWAPKPEDMH